jgi:hypothetical protein
MPPRKTDDANQTDGQDDVAGRNAASAEANRGQSAEGDPPAGTQMEARLQTAADSSVSPKSSTLQNPDAEIRADLTQDVLTANREAMQAEIRAGNGSTDGLDKLQELHQAVADAQGEVDAAIEKRNTARDAYDREVEAQAVAGERPFGELIAAAHAAADKRAAEEAELRKRQLAR